MLGEHPIAVALLATDLEESKPFYAGKLGLEILSEDDGEIKRSSPELTACWLRSRSVALSAVRRKFPPDRLKET